MYVYSISIHQIILKLIAALVDAYVALLSINTWLYLTPSVQQACTCSHLLSILMQIEKGAPVATPWL